MSEQVLILCAVCNSPVQQIMWNTHSGTEWTCPNCGVVQTVNFFKKVDEYWQGRGRK